MVETLNTIRKMHPDVVGMTVEELRSFRDSLPDYTPAPRPASPRFIMRDRHPHPTNDFGQGPVRALYDTMKREYVDEDKLLAITNSGQGA